VYGARRRKYEQAAAHLWKRVEPDPPLPEPAPQFELFQTTDVARSLASSEDLSRKYPDYLDAHLFRAWIRAGCSSSQFRDGQLAIASATRACELTAWKNTAALEAMAAACAEAGDFANAVKWEEKALGMIKNAFAATQSRDRLALYKAGKPFRQK
jgi:hypothetical protein